MPINEKNILFRAPVYTTSEEHYVERLQDKMQQRRDERAKRLRTINPEIDVDAHLEADPPPLNPEGISWKYNMIVGWIEFYTQGWMIKADLWFTRAQRVPTQIKTNVIDYKSKISDVTPNAPYLSNEEIRARILSYLADLQDGKYRSKLKRRFIDISWVEEMTRYLDIKALIKARVEEEKASYS